MTLEEAKKLKRNQILYHKYNRNADKSPQRWRVNGRVTTWKNDPGRFTIPIKHGTRDYDVLYADSIHLYETNEMDALISTVNDIPKRWSLLSNSQDIDVCLKFIDKMDERDAVGCLFVKVGEGDYLFVFACESAVPTCGQPVWRLR